MAKVIFEEMVKGLIKPGKTIANELTGSDANMLHMAIGISGEAGELLDTIKPDSLIIELGDADENIIVRKQVSIVDGELEILEEE